MMLLNKAIWLRVAGLTGVIWLGCQWESRSRSQVNLDRAAQGMVTSAHPLATQTGLQILQQGGNAIDAAVATTLAISVVEPFSAGIGGGGFLLLHQGKTGEIKALDFRERAPLQANRRMYLDKTGKPVPKLSTDGHLAVAVPGTVAGLYEAQKRYGKLPWARVVQPSIALAKDGFPVSWRFQQVLEWRKAAIAENPAAQKIFLPQGQIPKISDRLIQTDLAKTLQTIAVKPEDFYTGELAQAIVKDMQANGGIITVDDLKQYRPIWREPLCQEFTTAKLTTNPFKVCAMPPPSSGGVHLLQMLNLIDLDAMKNWGWHHPDGLHRLIESMRIAYADRATHLGDPDFTKVPVPGLISKTYAAKRRREINPQTATPSTQVKAADVKLLQESEETSHLTVVDRDRNAVSLTFTINLGFGAGVVSQGTGILLNNEMDDFAIAPNTPNAFGLTGQDANAIAPKKTPLSSMTPTIVSQNGQFRLATGSPGGSTIITTVLQTLINVLVYDMDIKHAIAAPRLHHQWLPDQTRIDRWGFDPSTIAILQKRGHDLREREPWGNANGIQALPDGSLVGAADPRGEGTAAGY
jgi:gamma-glutamyltranspeptidase / glutathione hydrolase